MPLFGKSNADTAPIHETRAVEEPRRSGLFGRNKDTTTTTTAHHNGNVNTTTHHGGGGGLFHRNKGDPSIVAARERVLSAENAERDADRALLNARASVREAREHVKRLEREAAEESVTLALRCQLHLYADLVYHE